MFKRVSTGIGSLSTGRRIVLAVLLVTLIGAGVTGAVLLVSSQQTVEPIQQRTPEERRLILLLAINILEDEQNVQEAIDKFLIIGEGKEQELADLVANPGEVDPQAIENFRVVWEEHVRQEEATRSAGTFVWSCIGGVLLLMFGLVFYLARRFGLFSALASLVQRTPSRLEPEYAAEHKEPEPQESLKVTQSMKDAVAPVAESGAPPIARFKAKFRYPNNLFRESFEIRDVNRALLGQVDVEIADVLRLDSEDQMPVAFHFSLYDLSDIATSSLVLLSPWVYNNRPKIKDELGKKGDVVMGEQNRSISLETVSLRLKVSLVEVEFGKEGIKPESFYDSVRFELSVFRK